MKDHIVRFHGGQLHAPITPFRPQNRATSRMEGIGLFAIIIVCAIATIISLMGAFK